MISTSTSTSASSLLKYCLDDYWTENGDKRIADYPFMASAHLPTFILLSYLTFVYLLGPRFMAHRPAYSLKGPMIVYNLLLSLFNGIAFVVILYLRNYALDAFQTTFPSLTDTSPSTRAIINLHYIVTLSKYVDLLDTVIFVLRKKDSQITALHVYHHFSVPIQSWTYFRLCANSPITIPFGLINAAVHTIMYAYYGLAAIGPHMQPYLWWKKYITQLQIIQFILLFVYSVYFMLKQDGYPLYFTLNQLLQSIIYMFLFTRFYLKTYKRKVQ